MGSVLYAERRIVAYTHGGKVKVSALIGRLKYFELTMGRDVEVLVQCHGCCRHGHPVQDLGPGMPKYADGVETPDEVGKIVIRV